MTHPWFAAGERPRVLAHRGLLTEESVAHGAAENSFAAVAAAHAAGAAYIESDCHLTADGSVVLFHDDDLSRVTGDPRRVSDVSLRELEALMAERGGLITLEQALESFPDVCFNLDVKATDAAAPVGRAVAPHAERVLLASFSDERRRAAMEVARATRADVVPAASAGTATITRVLAAVAVRSHRLLGRALSGVDALQVPERRGRVRVVTRRLVDAVHRHGVEVHVWTVNDADDMRRLLDLGIDGIVTDRADLALAVAAEPAAPDPDAAS